MPSSLFRRALSPIVELRENEAATVLLMFSYSFLAMTAYNIVQPITRSQFIKSLGADNLPYVLLVSVFVIGLIMHGYSRLGSVLPGRLVVPVTQGLMIGLLLLFWLLLGTGEWVAVALYLFGQMYGILLISQFWTLANLIYDPRQAKRVFGFIGGGASLGGILGGSLTTFLATGIGDSNLLLVSAVVLAGCAGVVLVIVRDPRRVADLKGIESAGEEKGVGGRRALAMLRSSRHLQVISAVILLTSVGAGLIDQQLNMAIETFKGGGEAESMTVVLAQVQVYTSAIGFVIQVWLTSRIQRYLGIGFALMILPIGLGSSAAVILVNAALWAPMFARVLDKSLRYTVDKTTREILFLPLPAELKQSAKPFVDVTVDRFGRAAVALLLLVLIKPWGFNFDWQQISYASLAVMALWIAMAVVAKRGYMTAFRRSLDRREVQPELVRLNVADLTTIETLVEELGSPEPRNVLYAIDLLESLDKRHLITPLLLNHDAPAVRARVLLTLESARPEVKARWAPAVERMLKDPDASVRASAVRALSSVRGAEAHGLMRPYLEDRDPRIAVTAAVALSNSPNPEHVEAAEGTLRRLLDDTRLTAAAARREVAEALAEVKNPSFRHLLVPLMYDPARDVAEAAIRTVGKLGAADYLFVPPLLTLMRNRLLKGAAREVLVGFGEDVVDTLAYFMRDQEEDVWVRRHVPSTLAYIPCQKSADVLLEALDASDGFIRFKAARALGRLKRSAPHLVIPREPIEQLVLKESNRYFNYLSLQYNLVHRDPVARDTLLARALTEKLQRTLDRIFRMLGLIYPEDDVRAVRWTLEHGDSRARASALEYLDNLFTGAIRRRVMLVLEELPLDEKVRRGNTILKSRVRDAEDSLAQLVHDDDQVVAATAMHFVQARGIWSLADDLEYALGHRDVQHWHVFEAASWALASKRLSREELRRRWMEPLPAVELADRLRRMPLFDFVSVDELFRVADAGRQIRYEPGRVIYTQNGVAQDLQLLLEGQVARLEGSLRGDPPGNIDAPAPLCFEEVIEGAPVDTTIRAVDRAICLSLPSEQVLGLLSENVELAQGLFRTVLDRSSWIREHTVVRGVLSKAGTARLTGGLQVVEKILLLSEMPVFSRASAADLAALAAISRETPLAAGSTLFKEGAAPSLYLVLSGEVVLEPVSGGTPESAGAGDTVGVYETLAGVETTRWRAHVTGNGLALRVERDALFDLLTDRIELLQGLFSALLRRQAAHPAAV
jgi:AAA family ATP:ADP antiporter